MIGGCVSTCFSETLYYFFGEKKGNLLKYTCKLLLLACDGQALRNATGFFFQFPHPLYFRVLESSSITSYRFFLLTDRTSVCSPQ